MTDAAADPALPGSAQRALQQRVDQVCAVLLRNSVPVVAADLLLAYAVAGDGLLWPAATWFVLIETSMLLRRRLVVRHTAAAGDPAAMMRQLVRWSALQGLLRAPIVVLAFGYGSSNTQVMVTMVMVGLAAGAVATCGGETRIFRNWSLPALGSLVVAWALQWNLEAATVALLLAYLHHVLAGYVAVLGVQGQRLLDYSAQLELERDRVREANVALEAIGVELRAERDRAAEANAAKTRVLASVSHDLRQPLFALSLNTAALGDLLEGSADTQLQRVESGLRRSLDQCRALLDQLVDFSRLEAGSVEVRWQTLELGPFLQTLATTYEPAARAAGLQWTLELDGPPRLARTDPLLLERLLGNLLQNAVKFTPRGRVGVRLGRAGARIAVEVFDTGPGIAPDQQQRVFEEFYQLDNPSRDRARGIGLGLSIVRRLAELLGAQIQLHSAIGQGCRFVLELPASQAAAAQPALAPALRTGHRPGAHNGRAPVILALDDEPELLADLRTLLGARGWQVLTAADPAQACAAAAQCRPDVVLADLRLRDGHSGLDAVRALRRALGDELPALIVTGDTAPQRIAEATASGLRVLHKPLDGQVLAQALDEALAAAPAPSKTSAAQSPSSDRPPGA